MLYKSAITKLIFISLCQAFFAQAAVAQAYWQQQVNFDISVSLNDKDHSLDGFERIEYINNSPDTLRFIWFHIWPNAYKHDKTAFSDQLLENGNTAFYFSGKNDKGYINRLDFRMNDELARMEDHPQHIDIVKVILPQPLPPKASCTITTPFHVKLPYNFSRGGHDGDSYQVTQWYPKPAVYDRDGWHPMPYLDQGEFYSEFGNYNVDITVPANYVIAATGELQNEEEKEWLKTRKDFKWTATRKKIKSKSGSIKYVTEKSPPTATTKKTVRFMQNKVHDFAWFADKRFIVDQDTVRITGDKTVEVFSFYTDEHREQWHQALHFAKLAVKTRSEWIGQYPYNTVSVVQGPESFGGGMEYPTITVIAPQSSSALLDNTIAHEIGHNWFYGILATNEREHPWLDEGLNTYYDNRYSKWRYPGGEIPQGRSNISIQESERIEFETLAAIKEDQPIATRSVDLTPENYSFVSYYKTAAWLEMLEKNYGREKIDAAIQRYYNDWQFRHPGPEVLKSYLQQATGNPLTKEFDLLTQTGRLPGGSSGGFSIVPLIDGQGNLRLNRKDDATQVIIWPALGFNNYDKLMAGVVLSNYSRPAQRLQFVAVPLYAAGSKTFNGIGNISYKAFPAGSPFHHIQAGLAYSRFTRDRYEDTTGKKTYMSFSKLAPRLRFTFREDKPRSTMHRYMQFKSFFIKEDFLTIARDSVFSPTDTVITERAGTRSVSRNIVQALFVIENFRALYPYRAELKAEHGKGFLRFAFTGNYFLNYPAKKGGVDLRLFAGKFIYTNKAKADRFLYGLNLSAPKGNLDYTYSEYFIGRNDYPFRFDGIDWTPGYQQIMIRDGGLKVNTDAQGNIGSSDNWVAAINAAFDIPDRINPLSVLPLNIGLKVFVDAGTYAEAWEKNATADRFLYDAGLQVSLVKDLVNIYIPVVYSSVFSDYNKSIIPKKNRFFKTISFSIDLHKLNSKGFTRKLLQ